MIEGKNLRLRAIEPIDIENMYRWENDPEIWTVSGTINPFSRYTIEQYIKEAGLDIYHARQLRFAVDKLNGSLPVPIGFIDLFEFDPRNKKAGVGILIGDKTQRQKGFGKEALLLLKDYSFGVLNLRQLFCHIPMSNVPSLKLFSSAGFEKAGELKDWVVNKNKWENVVVMQLINERQAF